MQKGSSRNTKMQKNKSFDSVVYITSTSTSTNISSAFAIDGSGCALSHHGVLNLDHHRQELSQHPGQRQPHTWWGFVVWFVKCNVFVAMYPRTTFYGFGSTTATCSPSHGRRRLPWPRPSRGSWCRSPTTLFSSGGDLSSPPSTRLQTGSFDQYRATVFRRRRWWHCLDSIYCLSGCRGRSTVLHPTKEGQFPRDPIFFGQTPHP